MARQETIALRRTIRRQQLREMIPLADSTIYEMGQRGQFPWRFALSPRCVVWDLSEIEAWLSLRRTAPLARAPHPDVKRRRNRPVKVQDRARRSASKGGLRTGRYFSPATHASTMFDHSCIICRRCTSYSALL
jgi:prophage regulatory protein